MCVTGQRTKVEQKFVKLQINPLTIYRTWNYNSEETILKPCVAKRKLYLALKL